MRHSSLNSSEIADFLPEKTTEKGDPRAFRSAKKRSQLYFNMMIGALIIVVSFTYGLATGLTKRFEQAYATEFSTALDAPFGNLRNAEIPEGVYIPNDVFVEPVGTDAAINGHAVKMVSFSTNRTVASLLAEQVAYWKNIGLEAFGTVGDRRGIAVATDKSSTRKHSITVFVVPPSIRKHVTHGRVVQGIITVMDGSIETNERLQQVPGVPVMPGGRSGAIFSSEEVNGRSYSGMYSNPGTVEISRAYYRDIMKREGWNELELPSASKTNAGTFFGANSLEFVRNKQELTILFTQSPVASSEETVATVILRPRLEFK